MLMKYVHEIEVFATTMLPNRHSSYSPWSRITEKKKWVKHIARNFIVNFPKEPLKKAKVIITRFSAREPDKDNLYASCKQLIDSLKTNLIIHDDAPEFLDINCIWEKESKLSRARTKIRVEEV
jgi:hypothetical protein